MKKSQNSGDLALIYLHYCFLLYICNMVLLVCSFRRVKGKDTAGEGQRVGGIENEEEREGTFSPLIILENNQDLISAILSRSN